MKKPTYKESEEKVNNLEENLKKLELQQLWNIFSQSPIPTMILSKDGKIVEYNEAIAELTGYTHKEVPDIGAWMIRLYPDEEYRNKVEKIAKRSMNKEINIKRDEFIITRKDSEKRHVEFSVYDIMHKGKQTDLQVVQGIDITDRKKAEEELKKFELMVESAHDAIFYKDLESRYIIANNRTLETFGLSREEVIGKNDYELMSDQEEAKKNVEDDQLVFMTQKPKEITKHMTAVNGKEYWFQAIKVPNFDDKGNIIGLVGIARDITERKRAEEELRESEERFRSLFESAPEFINILDRNGMILQTNPAVILRSGYTEEEMVGRSLSEFLIPASQKIFEKEFPILMEKGNHCVEVEFVCKNGTIINADCSCMVVRDEQGEFTNIVTFLRDITERKKAEDKLKLTQKELEIKARNLEETNTALKVLLKYQDEEKNIMEKNILTNLKTLILPYLEKIKIGTSDERQKTFVNIIETNLSEITKPFANQLTEPYSKLTPTEIQITSLIQENRTAKDIARILDVSETTVFFHRRNIRKKLGLKSKKTNLRSYLQYAASR